ncbi:MAG: polysaccharide pyruvyl transferase family protein [Alicyclobacillus sp.]|nr:polysaccharide pyruvyl transferase family protein [Alicyclobacillus sp.]
MRMTIANAYTWWNKGDAAIVMGTILTINRKLPSTPLVGVLSFTPTIDEPHYTSYFHNVTSVRSNLLNPYPFKKTWHGKVFAVVRLILQALAHLVKVVIPAKLGGGTSATIRDSDLLIICGGGFLGGRKFNSLIHLVQIWLLAFYGKPMVLWGTSVEPVQNWLLGKVTEYVLKKVGLIVAREEITYSYLQQFIPCDRLLITPDLAFMVEAEETPRVKGILTRIKQKDAGRSKQGNILIGITVRNWRFPGKRSPSDALEKYKDAVCEMVEAVSEQLGARFVFIPQVIMPGDDDRVIAQEIQGSLRRAESFVLLSEDMSPGELIWLISRFELFVGTRMHSNIFATGACVPTVAIAYESKTRGIMSMLGMDEFVVDIEHISGSVLIGKVLECYTRRAALAAHLKARINEVRAEITRCASFLEELVEQ